MDIGGGAAGSGCSTIQVELHMKHIMSEKVVMSMFPKSKLQPSSLLLKAYIGEVMLVVGELVVEVKYGQHVPKQLSLVIIKGKGQCLLGRSWFHHIQLDLKMIAAISSFQDPSRD